MPSLFQVEEVKRHSHCLAFSSAGPQSQIYYVSYDSYAEHLRWHRMASKVQTKNTELLHNLKCLNFCQTFLMMFRDHLKATILCSLLTKTGFNFHKLLSWPLRRVSRPVSTQIASQRVNSVDLSCCSLEELPAQLFYSQDLTHLNLKNNFMSLHKGVPALTRWDCSAHTQHSNETVHSFPFLFWGDTTCLKEEAVLLTLQIMLLWFWMSCSGDGRQTWHHVTSWGWGHLFVFRSTFWIIYLCSAPVRFRNPFAL